MQQNKQIGYQTESITVSVGATAGTKEATVILDQTYDMVDGLAIVPITDGDQANYNIGLNINGETILNLTDVSLLSSGSGVAPNEKFIDFLPRRAAGVSATLRIQNTGTIATDDLLVQFVFRLKRKAPQTALVNETC